MTAFETLLKRQEKALEARIKALGGSTTQPVVEELREDKALHPADAQQQTNAMVKKAWSFEAPAGL